MQLAGAAGTPATRIELVKHADRKALAVVGFTSEKPSYQAQKAVRRLCSDVEGLGSLLMARGLRRQSGQTQLKAFEIPHL
jgi:nickel-dependent lactate racemase